MLVYTYIFNAISLSHKKTIFIPSADGSTKGELTLLEFLTNV